LREYTTTYTGPQGEFRNHNPAGYAPKLETGTVPASCMVELDEGIAANSPLTITLDDVQLTIKPFDMTPAAGDICVDRKRGVMKLHSSANGLPLAVNYTPSGTPLSAAKLPYVIYGEQGEAGAIGPQGPQGIKGDTGDVGSQGPQGIKGDIGSQGPIGPVGPQGATGSAGAIGPQGFQGLKGDTGNTGSTGSAGVQGPIGPQGSTGSSGSTGSTGPQGSTGSAGSTGAIGPQGFQGNIGSTGTAGASGIVSSTTPPTDTTVIWNDTSADGLMLLPTGGSTGQILAKASASDFDTEWTSQPKITHGTSAPSSPAVGDIWVDTTA